MTFITSKTVLVTGANRGIGKAFVETLVEQGAKRVYAGIRDESNLDHFDRRFTHVVKPVHLDVTRDDHINALTAQLTELDILINNAGVVHGASVTAPDALAIMEKELSVNLYGPMHLTARLLPILKQSPAAAIVNLCSIAAISHFPGIGPYSVAKAALHSYTQGLRFDLIDTAIKVLGVYPGPTDTRMAKDFPMEKASPRQIAERTYAALEQGQTDLFPDAHSQAWYQVFLQHPQELEKLFTAMGR